MRFKPSDYLLMFIPFIALIALLVAGFVYAIFMK